MPKPTTQSSSISKLSAHLPDLNSRDIRSHRDQCFSDLAFIDSVTNFLNLRRIVAAVNLPIRAYAVELATIGCQANICIKWSTQDNDVICLNASSALKAGKPDWSARS